MSVDSEGNEYRTTLQHSAEALSPSTDHYLGIRDHLQNYVTSTRPSSAVRPCHVQTAPPPLSRPIGFAPRRLGTHPPLFYVKSIFPSVFPAPSPPPSGYSTGECLDDLIGSFRGPTPRVDGRAPLDDSRPIVLEDVDRRDSRTDSTRRTPGLRRRHPGWHSAWWHH